MMKHFIPMVIVILLVVLIGAAQIKEQKEFFSDPCVLSVMEECHGTLTEVSCLNPLGLFGFESCSGIYCDYENQCGPQSYKLNFSGCKKL